ncbi:hypothetical protein IIC_04822 [Bacillus cereus VD021]|uniref:Uncharacterized protein n=1 Tax=Bacillus cereus VD021 TaxID=1053224 RepID=R8HAW6_BACCE|nr:hypothetical protein IIC_04822 [Bacillus cereus VD021]
MQSHITRVGGALGFRLPTRTASEVVIVQSGLEQLPSIPGRAIYMKENFTELQVSYIDDNVMWKHLKEYEVEEHEHPESHENQPSDGDTCDD